MNRNWVIRNSLLSFTMPKSSLITGIFTLLITIFIFCISLCLGSEFIDPITVLSTLFKHPESNLYFTIETLRLPRVLMAAMVGMALGSSGLLLQSIIRNPLASPDIIGITSGASAAAVLFLSFFNTVLTISWLPVFAILGALLASVLIYSLAWRNGVTPMRLILIGIGVSAAMSSLTTFIIATSPTSTSITAYIWLTGSVYGTDWGNVKALFPWLIISLPMTLLFTRSINSQELGESIAIGLGISVQKMRIYLLFLSVCLAAPAIAYAGAIGFVGLIAPHIARRIVARSFGFLLPITALIGASLVMLADLCGRMLFQPLDIPAGVFVSVIGAPFFIYLLYRQRF